MTDETTLYRCPKYKRCKLAKAKECDSAIPHEFNCFTISPCTRTTRNRCAPNGICPPCQPISVKAETKLYPCADCGTLRTKEEGGTTFTVCDECWDKHYHRKPKPAPTGEELPLVNKAVIYDARVNPDLSDLPDVMCSLGECISMQETAKFTTVAKRQRDADQLVVNALRSKIKDLEAMMLTKEEAEEIVHSNTIGNTEAWLSAFGKLKSQTAGETTAQRKEG